MADEKVTATEETIERKRSGFDGPTIGEVQPEGTYVRRLPNGRVKIVRPGDPDYDENEVQ